jgi:4-diphosphocytidyl-2-C-methyl-D-erythritol kinase
MTSTNAPLQRLEGVAAPAKLNLFLHIVGRRADGYHLLQSVFMLIDWMDLLDFERRTDGRIRREDSVPGLPPEDLCVRAARALQAATGCTHGVDIRLDKRIPAEAGMGGGSSDAASCLLALNRLWGLGLTRRELARIGLSLGADVPFFLGGHNAWVEGVGEQLTPVSLPKARFVVVKPPAGASTQRIFSAPDLQRTTKAATIAGFAAIDSAEQAGRCVLDLQAVLDRGRNDLQPVAQALCPEIGHCIRWLESQGLQGRMTGSGSAVFAPVQTPRTLTGMPGDWIARECSNMDAHPLLDWCTD